MQHIDAWINVLRQRYQENPQAFRSERMCFLDHNFSQSWREQYQLFKTSEPDHKGLGRVLPGGASNFYDGSIPSFCQSNKPYTYERPLKGVPTANNGDCGVYAVKYIECHALGVSFDPKDFARCNAKKMRDNMVVDIWKELVDRHLKENVDGDKFVGMYD
ncbi:hypothetical protein YC2023_077078 [Brassica napus]